MLKAHGITTKGGSVANAAADDKSVPSTPTKRKARAAPTGSAKKKGKAAPAKKDSSESEDSKPLMKTKREAVKKEDDAASNSSLTGMFQE